MADKQSSPKMSSLAAQLLAMDDDEMMHDALSGMDFFAKVRSLAASVLAQDQTPGQSVRIKDMGEEPEEKTDGDL